jgi:xylose isomerase
MRNGGHDPFGGPINKFPWDDVAHGKADSQENSFRRADAAFEFFQKLGVEYYAL